MNLKNLIKKHLRGNEIYWCDHIKFWSRDKCISDGMEIDACGGFTMIRKVSFGGMSSKWIFCPICGRRNPYS